MNQPRDQAEPPSEASHPVSTIQEEGLRSPTSLWKLATIQQAGLRSPTSLWKLGASQFSELVLLDSLKYPAASQLCHYRQQEMIG